MSNAGGIANAATTTAMNSLKYMRAALVHAAKPTPGLARVLCQEAAIELPACLRAA
jgi:hypothetical protein